MIGRDASAALWLGLGWASIEVLYTFVNGIALASLTDRTDPEAQRAKDLLPPVAFTSAAPWWGAVERIGATALHIGFTLIVAVVPVAFIVTAAVHSTLNLVAFRVMHRWPIVALEGLVVVVGAIALVIGLRMIGLP